MPNELKYLTSPIPKIDVNNPLSVSSELSKIKGINIPNKKQGLLKSFFSSDTGEMGVSNTIGAISNIASIIPSANQDINTVDLGIQNVKDSANKALMSGVFGPWGQAAGLVNSVIDKTGGYTDASKGLGGKNDTLNAIASMAIPGAGWFTKKTDKFAVDDTLKNSSGFTGTSKDATKVAGNANAKFLFGRNKANSQIADMKLKQNTVTDILDKNKNIQNSLASNTQDISFGTQFKNQGGWSQGGIQFGQDGMKIKDLASVKKIARNSKNEFKVNSLISKHAKGGTLKKQGDTEIESMSVIPGGALHAHKHNLNSVDEDLAKQVTNKGVPVVSFEAGGEVNQHAEIERGEIIFRKEITEKLEELWKDGSEEAMIEAGKLIAEEIINNTIDKSEEYEIED